MSDRSFCYMLSARDFSFVYISESITEVLDFQVQDLVNRATIDIIFHPDERDAAMITLGETASNNKVACLVYLQLFHQREGFVDCIMAQSAVNNVIVGSISWATAGAAGAAQRNASAEEVIMITEPIDAPVVHWTALTQPRTAFFLDRFSVSCTITHCTNAAILNPETCVNHPGGIFRYVVQRDEQQVQAFIANLKRSGIAGSGEFSYVDFTMCTNGRELHTSPEVGSSLRQDEVAVSAIGSATSDALVIIVRRSE